MTRGHMISALVTVTFNKHTKAQQFANNLKTRLLISNKNRESFHILFHPKLSPSPTTIQS